MNKLESIRQKYGYVPSNGTKTDTLASQRFNSCQKEVPKVAKPIPNNQHQLSHNRISLFLLTDPPSNPPLSKQAVSIVQANPPIPQPAPPLSAKKCPDLNQSFVKSYEKTYDLLKNYRNRILTSAEKPNNQSSSKLIMNPVYSSPPLPPQPQRNPSKGKENQGASQVIPKGSKKYPKRCSPLQGVDFQSSVNIYGEIENISRLQSRIHQLIKDKSLR